VRPLPRIAISSSMAASAMKRVHWSICLPHRASSHGASLQMCSRWQKAHPWDRQSVGRGPRCSTVATRIADHLGIVLKPQKKAFFELATKRLAERKNVSVLRQGIHPEMERPAILNRSNPLPAGVTIGIPPWQGVHEVSPWILHLRPVSPRCNSEKSIPDEELFLQVLHGRFLPFALMRLCFTSKSVLISLKLLQ